jgi:glutathione S-transferase
MNKAATNEVFTLNISRTFNAKREAVFDAWTNAEAICTWFAPDASMTTTVDQLELKQGGRYQFQMKEQEGDTFIVTGEYVVIKRPEQLIFTWQWIHGDDKAEMLVTLDFIDKGDTTELQLTHEKLPNVESRDHHNEGWNGCLVRLGESLTS